MIQLEVFQFNPFQENTYLLWDDAGNGIVFDPGCYSYEERKEIKDFIIKIPKQIEKHRELIEMHDELILQAKELREKTDRYLEEIKKITESK